MERWEHTVANFSKVQGAVPELDHLGAQGWEAVGLVSTWGFQRMQFCPSSGLTQATSSRTWSIDGRRCSDHSVAVGGGRPGSRRSANRERSGRAARCASSALVARI
jgi:hypothetical protein